MGYIRRKDMQYRSKVREQKKYPFKGKKNQKIREKAKLPTWELLIEKNDIEDLSFLNLTPEEFYEGYGSRFDGVQKLLYENQDHKWRD